MCRCKPEIAISGSAVVGCCCLTVQDVSSRLCALSTHIPPVIRNRSGEFSVMARTRPFFFALLDENIESSVVISRIRSILSFHVTMCRVVTINLISRKACYLVFGKETIKHVRTVEMIVFIDVYIKQSRANGLAASKWIRE